MTLYNEVDMPIVPDLNEYIQPSPHSQEGVDELHQKVVQPVRELTGDRVPSSELKPPTLDDPIPADTTNLEGTRAGFTKDNQNPLKILLGKLSRKGNIIAVKYGSHTN